MNETDEKLRPILSMVLFTKLLTEALALQWKDGF